MHQADIERHDLPRSRLPLSMLIVALTGVTLLVVTGTNLPLGVPGEWTWQRLPAEALVLSLLSCGMVMSLCVAVSWLGLRRIADARRPEQCAWLVALFLGGFSWLWIAQESAPSAFQLSKAAWVLYYPGSSGYFTEAKSRGANLGDYLAHYEDRVAEGDVLHLGTHPPGLVVAYRGLMSLCAGSPAITRAILTTQPDSVRESFDLLERMSQTVSAPLQPLTTEDRAVLWLAALLVQFIAAATVFPLFGLLRQFFSAEASWKAVCLWPAIPALAVFIPKSDALFPCLGTALLLAWLAGWRRMSPVLCLATGAIAFVSLNLSLAILPVAVLAGLVTLWQGWGVTATDRVPDAGRRLIIGLAWGALGFLVPVVVTGMVADLNLFVVWSWNYRNHAAFYDQYTRTWWKWLFVNPIELAIAAGVPLAVLAVGGARRAKRFWHTEWAGMCGGCVITWGLLWLSGKNMGEAARLWMVVMPWGCVLAAATLSDLPDLAGNRTIRALPVQESSKAKRPRARAYVGNSSGLWLTALLCQFAASAVIVTRVVGFAPP